MPEPKTTGILCSTIQEMNIGDYIKWGYDGSNWFFGDNTIVTYESPIAGIADQLGINPRYWYGVKITKGLIVADRIIRHTWSWDALNTNKYIQGITLNISGVEGILRVPTGGVAYADENGNMSLTDKGYGGSFPNTNEFDKYILGFDTSLVQSGATLFDVFHHDVVKTWTQDTPITSIGANTTRVCRGGTTDTNNFSVLASSTANTTVGFRPVFEFKE